MARSGWVSRSLLVALAAAAAGCLSSPAGGGQEGRDGGGGTADGAASRCALFASAPPQGEVSGTFVDLAGVVTADLDGDGDRDLLLHGETPLGSGMVAVRLPQEGALQFHWSWTLAGPSAAAAADLVGGDGCAEVVVAQRGAATTPVEIFGQEVSGDKLFRQLSSRELTIDSSAGLWLVADARLGDGAPAVALATPSNLYALAPQGLLTDDAIRTATVPDFAAIRGIAALPRDQRSELLVAEDGRVRWMEPVLPGGQLQFNPRRVETVDVDPRASAGGADLDRDGEAEDVVCAGDAVIGLLLDDSQSPPTLTAASSLLSPACPPFAMIGLGRLDAGTDVDLIAVDACAGEATVSALVDPRVAAGPSLAATRVDGVLSGLDAAGLAVVDADGDGVQEVWLFDATGASSCRRLSGGELVACGE